jgi:hypothetical protein
LTQELLRLPSVLPRPKKRLSWLGLLTRGVARKKSFSESLNSKMPMMLEQRMLINVPSFLLREIQPRVWHLLELSWLEETNMESSLSEVNS